MNDLFLSYLRTYVPLGVASVLAWLAVNYNIAVGNDASAALGVALTALLTAVYYGVVRALESQWPWFGKLLGRARTPVYVRPEPDAVKALKATYGC